MSVLSPAKYLDEDNTIKDLSFNTIYPVGSIYMSVSNVNPSTLFGGTWEAWGSGRVPVGVDASSAAFSKVEQTGGEEAHTLTKNEMPVHNHASSTYTNVLVGANQPRVDHVKAAVNYDVTTEQYGKGETITIEEGTIAQYGVPSEGGGSSHNNLQPYITCYMWKRTN